MTQTELLQEVATVLDALEIPYFVTGSVAATFYGEPRFTNDIDIVVDLPSDRVSELCARFPGESYYLSEEAVRDAVAKRRQFNLIHPRSGLKVDFMVSRGTAFDRSRFERRRTIALFGDHDVRFATLEDVILKKLEFFQQGGSEKHLRDIAGILRVSAGSLELAYLVRWAEVLGVEATLRSVLAKAGIEPESL